MGLTLSTAARNAEGAAVTNLLDAGSGAATCKIYTGSQPASPGDTATGTLLATVTLADPAWGSWSSGSSSLGGTPRSGTGVAAGTAGWARMADSDGNAVMDVKVTATGGGGQIELATASIAIGTTVQITSGTLTAPAGTAG